jgi:hypothetical protein
MLPESRDVFNFDIAGPFAPVFGEGFVPGSIHVPFPAGTAFRGHRHV